MMVVLAIVLIILNFVIPNHEVLRYGKTSFSKNSSNFYCVSKYKYCL